MSLSHKSVAAALAAAPLLAPYAMASPFDVDSTSIAKTWELKSVFEYRDGAERDTAIFPKLALARPLGADLEAEIATSYRALKTNERSQYGFADSTVEMKWRFAHETQSRPAFVVAPELSLPTGNAKRGLGNAHAALVVPLVAQKSFGRFTLNGKLGYGRQFGEPHEEIFPLGVLLRYEPRDSLELGAEIAGEAPRSGWGDCELSSNVGFKWAATSRLEIHGLLGQTIRTPDSADTTRGKLVFEYHF